MTWCDVSGSGDCRRSNTEGVMKKPKWGKWSRSVRVRRKVATVLVDYLMGVGKARTKTGCIARLALVVGSRAEARRVFARFIRR